MSKLKLANLLQERTKQLKMSKSQLAEKSGISRQTLYKLLNAEIDEAKLSTLVKISETLNLHPMDLLRLYFDGLGLRNHIKNDDSGFLGDVTYPDNSIVMTNQYFTKVWNVRNLGKTTWKNRKLVCVDDTFEIATNNSGIRMDSNRGLKAQKSDIFIPDTKPGESTQISIEFKAPPYPCSVISYWKSVDENGAFCFPEKEGLSCQVKVVSV